jgi:hypothetical protein
LRAETVEFSSAASPGEMCSSIASTWSRCRAISGLTTIVGPSSSSPASW